MATISIERENGSVVFKPNPITIGTTDVVVFVNNDPEASHQITETPEPPEQAPVTGAWMKYALGPAVPGQDPFTSPGIAFGSASKTVNYCCALHKDTENGSIVVKTTA